MVNFTRNNEIINMHGRCNLWSKLASNLHTFIFKSLIHFEALEGQIGFEFDTRAL